MPFFMVLAFVAVETWGILRIVHLIGGGYTLLYLLGAAIFGGWLIMHGGVTALKRVQIAMQRGELPTGDLFAGLIMAFAGLLFILPGPLTDVIGLSLLLGGGAMRRRLGERLSTQMGEARPELKKPVTIDGEFQRKPEEGLR